MFIYKEVGKDHEDAAVPDHDGRIVKDVIAGVTQSFLEEGVDISVIFLSYWASLPQRMKLKFSITTNPFLKLFAPEC